MVGGSLSPKLNTAVAAWFVLGNAHSKDSAKVSVLRTLKKVRKCTSRKNMCAKLPQVASCQDRLGRQVCKSVNNA